MKFRSFRLLAGVFALAALAGTLASLHAAEDRSGRSERGGASAEDLRRYDRNGNGKLDPDEEAAKRADEARAKREKEKKR